MVTITNANELQDQVAVLPGGKDKDERPILLITIPAEGAPSQIGPSLTYLLSVYSDESRNRGVTVLLDTRKGHWKTARSYIRQVTSSLTTEELTQLIVVRPDAFWDKQRVENCTNTQRDNQIIFTSPSRLNRFVEQSQLPPELGGSYIYNHQQWIENRLKAEEYFKESAAALTNLEEFHQHLLNNRLLRAIEVDDALNISNGMADSLQVLTQQNLEKGQELLRKIEYDNRNRKYASESESMSTPQDTLDTIKQIVDTSSNLRQKQKEMQDEWKLMQKHYVDTKDLHLLIQGIVNVTNWILGPAENLLNSQHKVGHDVSSAEELRNAHEGIELKCWDAYGAYAELLYKIEKFPNTDNTTSQMKDLIWQKDFMDFVCRSFATRVEKRRNILITSLRFFRLVSEYFDRTGEVFESLVMGKVNDFSTAKQKLDKLQMSQINLDAMERQLVQEGEKLSDMLSMPVKDALGRELAFDYSEDIANIRDILDATTARKNLFSDSVELQKLTLEQVTHINAYESDAKQAILWLDELFQVMLEHHGHVGITMYEIQAQKDEHTAFQDTAKDTYNYGCQLLNASLVLRQSCKLSIQEHTILNQKIRHSWQRLLDVSQEQMTRLRVSAVFHRSVEDHCNQLRDLREAVATMPLEEMPKKQVRVRNFYVARERLLLEVGRMVRLGKLLRSRLKESLYLNEALMESENTTDAEKAKEIHDPSVQDNEIAVEAITEKLIEVTNLAEEMDQALRSAQQDCGLLTASSSTTTSASTTPTTVVCMSTQSTLEDAIINKEDLQSKVKLTTKSEDFKSDDEFLSASECTLPHSRSSSYNTASECENRYSPWWECDKRNGKENVVREKMVLGVGLPELPPANSVLKPSPEVPPGKIVREVTETTHLKVQHTHSMGVSSYVLTSEIAKDKGTAGSCSYTQNEDIFGKASGTVMVSEKEINDEDLLKRMKQCGDWLQLKILEVTPELTTLGNSLSEAIELQQAHDEVLRQLQNKQSPVEELLRQADQLISTQKPRAEVYAAMAESLGRAWKDINLHLELRKQILDLHVEYHTKADEFFSIQNSLDVSCSDSVVPIDIDAIKQFLTDIHDLRRSLLETLMSSLQIGNSILAKLRELGAEGTLDSRPERIRCSVNRAISQVQGWLDQLHTKRQILEITFTRRKSQLEQCLALAILASDLREVEDTLKEKREILKNTDELGDSSSSAELLQYEHKKLLPEAKQLQERAIKITKATEQLVESGCFAGDKATEQAYNVLSASSEYITELDQRNSLLDCVIAFFRKAQTALTKLDQLEIQIKTSELPSTSPQLAQLHEQCARAVQEITSPPIEEGYSILGSTEHRSHGTDGVKRMVEELENRKIAIDALCTAHREEKLRINQALNSFLEQQNELYGWLISSAEAFLQGHQDMGSDLPMARDFWDLHNRLLVDLQTKGNEINALLLTLPPVLEYLEDNQRHDVDQKVEELHQLWLKLKNILETRLDLSAIYVKFHMEADYVNKEIDQLERLLNESPKDIDEETLNKIEEQWESLIPLYQSAKNTGITFINATNKVSEPYLDTKRACVCVETVLEKLSGRQLVVTRNWQSFHTNVVEKREIHMQLQLNMTESTKTINWVTKLDSQLYPVITTNATNPEDISAFLEQKLETAFPEIKRAQAEVEQRIKTVDALINKTTSIDEQTLNVKNKLVELNEKLVEITTEYQILLQMLITYFNNLTDMDNTVSDLNSQLINKSLPNRVAEIDAILSEQEASRRAVMEMFKFAQNDADKLCTRINKQEPKDAAEHDINKLQHQIVVRKSGWDENYTKTNNTLEIHRQYCQFNFDLSQINEALTDLAQQLSEMKGQYGESLPAAKATSQAFSYFEKTTEILNQRIKTFINESKSLIDDGHVHSGHIDLQITELQDRWDDLKKQIEETRQATDLSIKYFSIVEEAIDWFKQGSHILVSIARKTTAVKKPEEAQALLNEIEEFLKPGEVKQAERIAILTSLARELYQPQIRNKSTQVANDNQEMLESFSSIGRELHSLIDNLKLAEEERERLKREQEAADALLAAAKEEAEIARATAVAAENARREAEAAAKRIAEAEAKRRAEEEARRLAEEESRKRAEEEARRLAEVEARRRAEEEARRLAEIEVRRLAEVEARRRAEEEARQRAEEEARRLAEIEALKRAEEEARRLAEVEARRRAEEEARQRAEEDARRLSEIEAIKRAQQEAIKCAEEEARRLAEVEARRRAEEEARQRAEEEARRLAEIEAIKRAEEEARRRAEEEARKRAEEEDKRRAVEEAKRVKQIMEVDKVSKIITTNVEIPVKSAELSSNEIINKEIITRTVEVVTVKHLDQSAPKEVSQASISIIAEPPVFVLPLTDTELQEGSKFTFICQVRGSPTPSVVWYKDGIAIENNPDYKTSFNKETCTLTIEETFADDSAKYTCKATNPSGSAETSAVLSVKEVLPEEELIPPTFVKYLEPAAVKQGQKFQFECKVKGNPLPTVQWFKNNECIDNYPDYSITYNNGGAILKFEEVSLNDKANYTCKASNRVGTAQSTANLCVQPHEKTENPCFIIPLSNVMARAGQKIKLECEVSGLPTPSLTWSHDGKPVKETRELKLYSDDRRNILAISEAFPKDAGTYIVTAKNIVGETTSECTVTVKGRLPTETSDSEIASDMEPIKPSIQVPLKDISVFDGKTVRLDCVIVGQPEPEVIWYHDEKPVKESADFQLLFQGDRCSLVIQEAFAEDAGEYKVVALNSAGEASSKCVLTVTPLNTTEPAVKEQEETKPTGCPPKFNKLLSDVLASEGDKVTLEAVIEGVPYPEVKWLLNNQDIDSGEHLKLSHNNDGVVKLEIEKVLPEDKGVYTVKATNVHGDAKCFSQLIVKSFKPVEIQKEYEEVKSPPTFRETFTDRQAFVDTAIKFECIVAGKPTPKVKWLFNDEPVAGKDFLISTSGDRQVLSIPNVSLSNAGKITCIAENDIGKAICTATLSVVPPSESIVEPKLITDVQQLSDTSSFSSKKEVYLQSSTTSTSTVITNTAGGEPDVQSHAYISKDSQSFKQVNQEPPEVHESHVVEEFHKLGKEPGLVQERFSTTIKVGEENKAKAIVVNSLEHPTRVIKQRPPKFTNPIMGKIVDQGVDVVLEGIIDSYPAPSIKWEKNGVEIGNNDKVTTSFEFNKVRIEVKNVTSNDAGRYTCTAVNDAGSAISTSDLVVRKTIFPPVFGRRLQAQVVKKGDRVHMDVEVTGTPTPTVTWFKDEKPIKEVLPEGYKIRVQGNSHTLVIEKVDFVHTGKYMARAVNDGGEAQSIADFVVFEPTPDTMVEVVKTVVFEDVHKHETLAQAAEQSKATYTAPQVKSFPISVSRPQPVSLISFKSTPKSHIELSENLSQSLSSEQAEYSTVRETTISKESKTIKIESNTADFSSGGFKSPVQKEIFVPTIIEKPIEITQEKQTFDDDAGIESASITKQSSLDYFVQKLKESEEPAKPKDVPKGTPLQPGIYTKFEDASQTDTRIIPTQLATETLNESMSAKLSYINEPFNLVPEPPPEICFTPRKETYLSQNEEVFKTETAHKHFKTSLEAPASQFRPTSPKPSAEALEMEKLWTPHREPERSILTSPLPTRPISSLSEPSPKGLAMEKAWAHKSEIHRDHVWPPTQPLEETKSWSTQTTLEKKWIPTQTKSFTSFKETTVSNEPIHYVAKVTDLHEKGYDNISSMMHTKEINENIVYEQSAKPSEIIKSWPPPSHVEDVKPVYKPVMPSIHSLSIRPASVQDITDEVYLEPGPPPEIDYAPPPLPPKQERPQAPPVPARPFKPAEYKKPQTDNRPFQKFRKLEPFLLQGEEKKPVESETKTFQKVPKLEPFPFQVDEMKPKPIKTGPPITPSKFLKGRFADSDYESDYELSRIPPKWKPATSDTEELTFKHVKAPKFSAAARSKSVEPVPLSTKFVTPTFTHQPYKHTSYVGQKREISPPLLRPGTPPEYLEIHSNFKTDLKSKQTVDGYMADTDEPLTLKKKISKFESKQHESTKSEYYSSSETSRQNFSYESQATPKPITPKYYRKTTTSAPKKELIATPIITSVSTTKNKVIHRDERDPMPYTPDPVKIISKGPPTPSPSKFVKGEFRGSDYESDYEGRISSVWRADSDRTYKPVRPVLTPSGRHSEPIGKTPIPPTEFDQPPQFTGPPRPKFEPIEKPLAASKLSESLSHKSTLSQVVHKPKPVTPKVTAVKEIHVQPSETKYAHSPKVTQYYRSTTSEPYQNAIQTETSNVMHFKESSESCHRSMSLEQTRKVITFGQDKKEERIKEIGPAKFLKSDFRKSDHVSELDHSKIKSVWTPRGDGSLPHYRTVKAPQTPTKFDKVQQERILSPMEFERPSSTFETKTYNSTESKKNVSGIRRQFEENVDNKIVKYNNVNLKPGSPPEYSYSPVTVTKIASKNMENLSHTFKSKAQQFASDIMMDVNKKSDKITDNSPQVYKEETRASQHGTKHVDPDTGLIYFKYDFGYEFGIILPGQSKGGEIVTPKKTIIEPPKRTKDIEMPVHHESSYPKYNSGTNFRPVKITTPSKTVKWEPTSESEMSEYEDGKKKYLSSPRWEQSSTSPMSISPSLPSTSPAFNTAGFRSTETRFSAPSTPVNYVQNTAQPKKPPIFITPLRDIAVVSGQAARFECIVQSEPPPSILWSKNGRIIENSNDLQIYYRNGVCRLTIPQAFPEDAGSYTCTATNQIGAVGTTATLQVPGERRSQYIK